MDELTQDLFYESNPKTLQKVSRSEKKEKRDEQYQKIKPLKKQKNLQRRKEMYNQQIEQFETEEEKIKFKKLKNEKRERLKRIGNRVNEFLINCKGIEALTSKYRVVIDCAYKELMQPRETASLAKQIQEFYAFNRQMENPVHIYATSVYPELQLDTYQDITRLEEEFYNCKEFEPDSKFIYLTPDADDFLQEIKEDEIYVIGGLVDKVIAKNSSLYRAKALNIRSLRLPIDQYFRPEYKKALNVSTAALMIPAFLQYKDWKLTFDNIVPKKFFQIKKNKKQKKLVQQSIE